MQELTRVMIGCSMLSIGIGDKRKFADSGEPPRKGMSKLARCGPPLDARLNQDDHQYLLHLLGWSTCSGMASVDGNLRSSGELTPAWWRQ
jgi:hypothetical protein